jgi:hypothetical protein
MIMPTIEAWETALAVRDGVFLQIAVISVVAVVGVGFLFKVAAKLARVVVGLGLLALLALLAFSVWNIYAWTL